VNIFFVGQAISKGGNVPAFAQTYLGNVSAKENPAGILIKNIIVIILHY